MAGKYRSSCLDLNVLIKTHWATLIDNFIRDGPLARYVKLRVRMRWEYWERFPRQRR